MDWPARLRADARALFEAGVAAVEPRKLVREHLESRAADAAPYASTGAGAGGRGAVRIAAVGKAAAAMARGALDVLGERAAGGVIVAPPGATAGAPPALELYAGGHPIPDAEGVRGAQAILELARGLGAGDTLVCLISGGGSALGTLPAPGIGLDDLQRSTELLLRSGATIAELNCFRKHVDQLKGGRLAAAAAPARVVALVLSDVVGDPLDVIASGPVSPDPTTFADALAVLDRYELRQRVPGPVRAHLEAGAAGAVEETPGAGDETFERVAARVIGSNRMAAAAALEEARRRGYESRLLTTEQTGEARHVGAELAAAGLATRAAATAPACLLAAGETTVTVTGSGRGGRNQELVLGAALALDGSDRVLVASMGTDGIDGPTDAAGALADGRTVARARAAGLDPEERLANNDAYPLFQALGDLIVTGPTGTNVMDLMVVLVLNDRR